MQTYKLLKEDTVLISQPHLIKIFGRSGAALLCQINYWIQNPNSGVTHEGLHWIYNTAEEWGKQITLSERQTRHYIKKFSDMGILLIKKFKKKNYNQTNYYTINYDILNKTCTSKPFNSSQPAMSASLNLQSSHPHNTKITNIDKNNKSNISTLKNTDKKEKTDQQTTGVQNKTEQVEKNLSVDKYIKEKGRGEILSNTILQKPSITTVQDMLKDWNKAFPESQGVMNKELAKHLFAAFSLKCDKNMMKWKNYLDRLKSSEFIMSDKFKLSLDWALKFKTIDRIFKGDLGVKDIAVQLNESSEEQKAIDHIKNSDETLKCQHARSLILSKIGAIKYNAWFTKVKFAERAGALQMKADTKFIEDYVMQHFGYLFL